MRTIEVIISKAKNRPPPKIENPEKHKQLLKALCNAIGKSAPWERKK